MTDKLKPLDLASLPKGMEAITLNAIAARILRETTEEFVQNVQQRHAELASMDPRFATILDMEAGPKPKKPGRHVKTKAGMKPSPRG